MLTHNTRPQDFKRFEDFFLCLDTAILSFVDKGEIRGDTALQSPCRVSQQIRYHCSGTDSLLET